MNLEGVLQAFEGLTSRNLNRMRREDAGDPRLGRQATNQRRGWDSNPRGGLAPPTRFPVALLKPLGHLSGSPRVLARLARGRGYATSKTGAGAIAACGCLLYTSPSPRDGLIARLP